VVEATRSSHTADGSCELHRRKISSTQSPPKVCYSGLNHSQDYLKMDRRCCKKFRGHRGSTIVLHGADIPRSDIQTVQQRRWTRAQPGTAELVSLRSPDFVVSLCFSVPQAITHAGQGQLLHQVCDRRVRAAFSCYGLPWIATAQCG
jgi:hypothetical protein